MTFDGLNSQLNPNDIGRAFMKIKKEAYIEKIAKAMWEKREQGTNSFVISGNPIRAWDAYPKGKENYDCNRFEFDRDDHRRMAQGVYDAIKDDLK